MAFQILDENNMALLTHPSWLWAMPKENRGCIGCHEDRELTPPNRLAEALKKPAPNLNVPPENRRTVDFRYEIGPLIAARCVQCHDAKHDKLDLSELGRQGGKAEVFGCFPKAYKALVSTPEDGAPALDPRYVRPGSARDSSLIWHIFGKRFGRVDSAPTPVPRPMPPEAPLNDSERTLFVEWIDLGAQWNNRPRREDVAKEPVPPTTSEKGN
jgi:hypothetical protein